MKELVHMVSGGVGAGKTTYAKKLCDEHGGVHFSVDDWNLTLFAPDFPPAPDYEWSMERLGRVFTQMKKMANQLITRNVPVVLDLGFLSRADRRVFSSWAEEHGYRACVHFIDVPMETRWQRVLERNKGISAENPQNFAVTREMFDFCEGLLEKPSEDEFKADLFMLKRV